MEHLYTSKRMSRVFRGLVLALALVLVACGGDSDEPEPTATADVAQEQEALPTVPPVEGTPDASVSEDEITVLEPEFPATAEASTPDASEEVAEADVAQQDPEATPPSTLVEIGPQTDAATADAESANDDAESTPATADAEETEGVADPATAEAEIATDQDATVEAGSADTDTEPTERARTGNETFTHPGDGTGGSGMPGELDSADEPDEAPEATPSASPIAQLEISGCDVPDVPGFLGESNVFVLTADVNFRSGPGVACDPVFEESIGEGQIVLVLGGPVTQADDGTEWVMIEVGDESGWITTEFLEPSE